MLWDAADEILLLPSLSKMLQSYIFLSRDCGYHSNQVLTLLSRLKIVEPSDLALVARMCKCLHRDTVSWVTVMLLKHYIVSGSLHYSSEQASADVTHQWLTVACEYPTQW
jgi:hypothetical protein